MYINPTNIRNTRSGVLATTISPVDHRHIATKCQLATIVVIALLSAACGPGTAGDGGEDGTGESTGIDSGEYCESDAELLCGDLDRCWVHDTLWPAWLQYADLADIQASVDALTLTPEDIGVGLDCYAYGSETAHVCMLELDCETLAARPVVELGKFAPSDCAPAGPWDETIELVDDPFGECWARFGDVAVRVMVDNPTVQPDPGLLCVDRVPGHTTCVATYADIWSLALLPCQVQAAVDGGLWGDETLDTLQGFGDVSCHTVTGSAATFCIMSNRVVLTSTADTWAPTAIDITGATQVEPPC